MTENYPVYAKLSDQKLAQLGIDNLEIEDTPFGYPDPAWDYTTIFKLFIYVNSRFQAVILAMSQIEKSTPESNLELDNRLSQLIDYLQSIRERLR